MTIKLSQETTRLLDERMKTGGFADHDSLVRSALLALEDVKGDPIEDLDPETQAALARAEAQLDRGESRPWEDVKKELRARFKR